MIANGETGLDIAGGFAFGSRCFVGLIKRAHGSPIGLDPPASCLIRKILLAVSPKTSHNRGPVTERHMIDDSIENVTPATSIFFSWFLTANPRMRLSGGPEVDIAHSVPASMCHSIVSKS
jgi:hypothetical protein